MTQKPLILCGLALLGLALASCADRLACDFMCTPAMWSTQDTLTMESVDYNAIFGKDWVAGVAVVPTKAAPEGPSTDKPRGHVL